jgi:hypothetical protein
VTAFSYKAVRGSSLDDYARANPVNFVDPSGRSSAAEYGELALNSIKTGVKITAITAVVKCQLWAIASTVGIIGQHLGLDVQEDQIETLWNDCAASLTLSNFARNAAFNSAFGFGGGLVGGGIGWLLGDAEQGLSAAADAARGATKSGGFISSTTNAAGGTVITASGTVLGSEFEADPKPKN